MIHTDVTDNGVPANCAHTGFLHDNKWKLDDGVWRYTCDPDDGADPNHIPIEITVVEG